MKAFKRHKIDFVEVVMEVFKFMDYPHPIQKIWFAPAGCTTTWVKLAATIDWLVDWVKEKEEDEQEELALDKEDYVARTHCQCTEFVMKSLMEYYVYNGKKFKALELKLTEDSKKDYEQMHDLLRNVGDQVTEMEKEKEEVEKEIA